MVQILLMCKVLFTQNFEFDSVMPLLALNPACSSEIIASACGLSLFCGSIVQAALKAAIAPLTQFNTVISDFTRNTYGADCSVVLAQLQVASPF